MTTRTDELLTIGNDGRPILGQVARRAPAPSTIAGRSALLRYTVGLVAIAVVVVIKLALNPMIGAQVPFLLVFGALTLTAWYGGTGPAIAATGAAALAVWFFFLPPYSSFALRGTTPLHIALFVAECATITAISTSLQKSRARSDALVTELLREQEARRVEAERFRLFVESVRDYALFMLNPDGTVASWNAGAERFKGYKGSEIIGQHFSAFYSEEDRRRAHPQRELALAREYGRYQEEGWRIRKDGTRFWADVTITAIHDDAGRLIGFGKVTRDMTERRRAEESLRQANEVLEQRVRERTAALEATNKELEAFSYSVSHDLRAPLRGVDGFAKMLLQKYGPSLDDKGRHYCERIRAGTQRMAKLIDDLLRLSRLTRAELRWLPVDLSLIASEVNEDLRKSHPERHVTFDVVAPSVRAVGDPQLLRVVLENLLGNAWKFTSKRDQARIELGAESRDGERAFYVRDNGAGFEMEYADKLFAPFQRLHDSTEFEGSGIGLATVQRIILRHGGRVWAEGSPDKGSTFWFTLSEGEAVRP